MTLILNIHSGPGSWQESFTAQCIWAGELTCHHRARRLWPQAREIATRDGGILSVGDPDGAGHITLLAPTHAAAK